MDVLRGHQELSIFRCELCKLRLDYPIMKVQQLGTICGSCYKRGVFTHATQDLQLEEDTCKLTFPCRYQRRGCIFEASLLITCYHESRCKFRDRICPLVYENLCEPMLIPNLQLIWHFKNYHNDRILKFESNDMIVENPSKSCDMFYLILLKDRYFLLRIKLDTYQRLFWYAFYYFNNAKDPYTFSLCVRTNNFNLICRSFEALDESEISYIFSKNHCLEIDSSILNLNFEDKIIFITNYEHTYSQEKLKSFECLVCFDYMLAEINICTRGHSICHECKKKLVKCPTCQSYCSGRNYSLESLVRVTKFPCKNSILCNKYVAGAEYKCHSLNCSYKSHKCPFLNTSDRCTWQGFHHSLLDHLVTDHEGLIHNNGDSLIMPFTVEVKYVRCFILENDVAIFAYELNNDSTISLEASLLEPIDNNNELICTFLIGEQTNTSICLTQLSLPFSIPYSVHVGNYITNEALEITVCFTRNSM